MPRSNPLAAYQRMRDFAQTPEPAGGTAPGGHLFVVQKHAARSLHYDFRLELDGTLKSWAIPKGPSLDPAAKRMAVHVEDHPVSYANFEGTIPQGHYGAGDVIVWDRGSWSPLGDPRAGMRNGKLEFELHGTKLHGRWALVRMRRRDNERQEAWLLMKGKDAHARDAGEFDIVEAEPDSVLVKGKAVKTKAPGVAPAGAAKAAGASVKIAAKKAASGAKALAGDLKVTHADRVIDAQSGVTKGELVAYFAHVAPLMLPHLHQRPVAMLRAPAGVGRPGFFQKHADETELPGVERLDPSLDPSHEPLVVIPSERALLSAAQMNVVELHTWNATQRAIARPDRVVFDLDPGSGVAWPQIVEATELLHAFLDELGLVSFLKTSGGKGLHVVVPLKPRLGWDAVKAFSKAVVDHVAEVLPDRFVAKSGPKNRVGRIFVDYLRNGFGATTVCAWSPRARAGLGISVPIGWDELKGLRGSDAWTVRNAGERLATGNTPWQGYEESRQSLGAAIKRLGAGEGTG
jgi:DNA ligase D-like protein (predicted polymerase)/DNA ligase D-like protein (predicted 3'-phosphoesterase)